MPAETIPFNEGQASGIDELGGATPAVINVTHDAATLRTRPGLSTWDMFPSVIPNASPVVGAWVYGAYLVYVTEDRKLWALIASGLVVPLSSATATTQLDGTLRPQAVVTATRIVIIGGGVPQKWEGAGVSARLGGSPPAGVAIAFLTQTLVIATAAGLLYFSQPGELGGGHEDWRGDTDSAEAEAGADGLVALAASTGEMLALGTETAQIFFPGQTTGDDAFINGTVLQAGCTAGSSLIKWDDQYVFLDNRRRIVATNGRSLQDIAGPGMAKTFWRFATVDDCWAFRARFDGVDLLGFVFPTEGRACVYNANVQKWAEWRSIDPEGRWQPWIGRCHCYWPARALHLIGLADGSIAVLDPDAFTEDGQMLKAVMRTGFGDRSTGNKKVCERVQLTMRRPGTAAVAPVAELRWRDDLGAFGQPLRFSMGAPGDYETQVQKWTLGVYGVRQWELTVSAPTEFVLTNAEEIFTPLEA
jgi:hypothetical protein